ncbi:MAG TPA: branched-chain amino acid ABC transporter permease [Anaerolineae bacterium]|nr:branched-chain amino acid ABC transporter permease [Anaerolineae bacterium]
MTLIGFFKYFVSALQWGSFYALIAIGYSMVYGVLMLFNFAHGDIFMAGSYIGLFISGALLAISAGGLVPMPSWLVLILTIVGTMAGTSIVGMLVERIAYRPLRNAPRASAAVTGLMIGLLMETANLWGLGAERRNFPSLIETQVYKVGGISITNTKIMIVGVSLALMYILHVLVHRTKWGMAMRAMAYDFPVVPLMGVSINTIASATFALGSSMAAIAGIFFCIPYPVLEPYMGILIGWKAFVAAILGGRGSIIGAMFGGYLLGFTEIFVAAIFPSTLRDLIAYSIVLILLTFRPHGFFGEPYSAQLRL